MFVLSRALVVSVSRVPEEAEVRRVLKELIRWNPALRTSVCKVSELQVNSVEFPCSGDERSQARVESVFCVDCARTVQPNWLCGMWISKPQNSRVHQTLALVSPGRVRRVGFGG